MEPRRIGPGGQPVQRQSPRRKANPGRLASDLAFLVCWASRVRPLLNAVQPSIQEPVTAAIALISECSVVEGLDREDGLCGRGSLHLPAVLLGRCHRTGVEVDRKVTLRLAA